MSDVNSKTADRTPTTRRRRAGVFVASLALSSVSGCLSLAGPLYDEVPESAPHATLEFVQAKGFLASRAWPIELNGAPPKYWKWNKFRVPVGTFRLLVGEISRSDDCWTCAAPRYTCQLSFEAEAGSSYSVSLKEEPDGYSYEIATVTGMTVAACRSTGPDTIERLLERLRKSAEWASGGPVDMYPRLQLPATANADQLIAQLLEQQIHYLKGIDKLQILDSRNVYISQPSNTYLAVLIETNHGQKVVLFKYDERATGWWRSVLYDAEPFT